MPIYLYGAALCWLAFKGKYFPRLISSVFILYLGYAVYLVLGK
jgi:uncharacterized membrane protein